jgi:hypothetical protein
VETGARIDQSLRAQGLIPNEKGARAPASK